MRVLRRRLLFTVLPVVLVLVLRAGGEPPATSIRFSGYLGQSEPGKPLDFIGVNGLAGTKRGCFFWYASKFYRLDAQEKIRMLFRQEGGCRQLLSDGADLWLERPDGKLLKLNRSGTAFEPFADPGAPQGQPAFVPAHLERSGWGKRLKLAVIRENAVIGYDAAGRSVGKVLDLPEAGSFNALGFLPESGELLASTAYPDCRIFRFRADGTPFAWALRRHLFTMIPAGRALFGADTHLQQIPEDFRTNSTRPLTRRDDMFIFGVAPMPGGGYYVGSSQGILRYPEGAALPDARIGGFPGCRALAVNDDGVLLALSSAERGTVFALDAGGESDTPFLSSSNTTSVGLWNSRRYRNGEALAVTAAGGTFYLLNRSRERVELWRFTPADGPAPGDAWKKLPDPPAESTAVAAWNRELFVLAAGRVWQLEGGKFVPFPTDIPVRHLAAAESGLCIAGEDRLIFLRADIRTGTFSPYREIPVANVTAVAAEGDRILISKPGALELYSAEDGSLEARLSVSDYAGGPVALCGNWLWTADAAKMAIARFRVERSVR